MTNTKYMTGMEIAIRRVNAYAAEMVNDYCDENPEYYGDCTEYEYVEYDVDVWVNNIIKDKFETHVTEMIHSWNTRYDWTNDAHPTCIGKSIRYIVDTLTRRYGEYNIDTCCYTDYGMLQMIFAYVYITEHPEIIQDLFLAKLYKDEARKFRSIN